MSDPTEALPVGAYVASALMAANYPGDSGEDVDRFLAELDKRGYRVTRAASEDDLRDHEWCVPHDHVDHTGDVTGYIHPAAPGEGPEALRAILETGIKDLGGTHRFDLARALDALVHLAQPAAPAEGLAMPTTVLLLQGHRPIRSVRGGIRCWLDNDPWPCREVAQPAAPAEGLPFEPYPETLDEACSALANRLERVFILGGPPLSASVASILRHFGETWPLRDQPAAPAEGCRHGYVVGTFCSECPDDLAQLAAPAEGPRDHEWCVPHDHVDHTGDVTGYIHPAAPGEGPEALRAILETGIKDLGGTHRFDLARALDALVHLAQPAAPAEGLDPCPHCDMEHVWPCPTIPRCDEPGCERETSCGFPTDTGYRRTCGDHYRAAEAER